MIKWLSDQTVETISSLIQAIAIVIGIGLSLYIYRKQTHDTIESEKQAHRARLTETYMRWHSEILKCDKNIEIAKMCLPSLTNTTLDTEHGRKIQILFMLLNAMFLEWNYRKTYKEDINEFYKSMDITLGGLATSPNPEYRQIVDDFSEIFGVFPDDFTDALSNRLLELRKKHGLTTCGKQAARARSWCRPMCRQGIGSPPSGR